MKSFYCHLCFPARRQREKGKNEDAVTGIVIFYETIKGISQSKKKKNTT